MQSILETDASILQAAMNFLGKAAGGEKNASKNKKDTYLGGSISKYTKDLVMTFPLMFDTSLSPATAGIISRANERNIITMLELLFGSMQLSAKTGKDAIQQVHKNLSSSMGLDDIFNAIDDMQNASNNSTNESYSSINNSFKIFDRQNNVNIAGIRTIDSLREMTDFLKTRKQKSYPINSLKEKSLNEYMVFKDFRGNDIIREAAAKKSDSFDQMKNERDDARLDLERNKREDEHKKYRREEQLAALPRVMSDQDFRKANELAPTLMIITFNEIDNNDKFIGKTAFAAGVKSRMIPVESSDIIDRLAAKKNTALNFVNFIRATTGEISFTKDFLFCISQSKILAKNNAKKGPVAKMWDVLDSRHTKNNKNAKYRSGNDASAITTLVVNQETANMLKKEYNYNIEDNKTARYIMSEYNLLGLIICDESIEIAKILYHGNDGFEQIPYSFLSRENDNAKAYKDVINLVNKTGR